MRVFAPAKWGIWRRFISAHSSGDKNQMNTEIISHPKLQHYGLITANLGAMIDWYPKVLGPYRPRT